MTSALTTTLELAALDDTESVSLPGANEVDPVLLDRAVDDLNRMYVGGQLDIAISLGEYSCE